MLNFSPLTAEICWRVWAPRQISTGFASWLRYCTDVAHRRSTKLCTMFGCLLRWGVSCPLTEVCQLQNSLCVQVLRSPRYCTVLEQWASAKVCGVVQGMELRKFRRRRHLYSADRPSRWALAHVLVFADFVENVDRIPCE